MVDTYQTSEENQKTGSLGVDEGPILAQSVLQIKRASSDIETSVDFRFFKTEEYSSRIYKFQYMHVKDIIDFGELKAGDSDNVVGRASKWYKARVKNEKIIEKRNKKGKSANFGRGIVETGQKKLETNVHNGLLLDGRTVFNGGCL